MMYKEELTIFFFFNFHLNGNSLTFNFRIQ